MGKNQLVNDVRSDTNCYTRGVMAYSRRYWESFVVLDSDWLRAERSRDRILLWAIFSVPFQSSLLYNGCRFFLGVKRLGRGVDHPTHLAPKLRKE
jgi:hypothetical protein